MPDDSRPTFSTPRLLLRPLVPTDAEAVRVVCGERDVAKWTETIPHPYPDELADEFIQLAEADEKRGDVILRGIVLQTDGIKWPVDYVGDTLVGTVSLKRENRWRHGYVGYVLDKRWWGQGLVPEAVSELCRHAFEELDYVRVWSSCIANNVGSARVLQKCGFAEEGIQRKHFLKWGEWKDVRLFGLLREEWEEQQPRS